MSKLLRLKDYILLSAAFAGDMIEDIHRVGGIMPTIMKNAYGYVPARYKKSSYATAVSQMLSVGDIKRITDKNGQVHLELTSTGSKHVKRRFSLFNTSKKWDGLFMVVVFDIPESKRKTRNDLRSKLYSLGFGMLQQSVWISPYHFEDDLREFFVNNDLGNKAYVLSAQKMWTGDLKKMAEQIWNLKRINQKYEKVIEICKKATGYPTDKRQVSFQQAHTTYFDTLSKDPLLPKKLLPNYWLQQTALKMLNKFNDNYDI